MNPSQPDQQGYYQPDQNQPVAAAPPPASATPAPVAAPPVQPVVSPQPAAAPIPAPVATPPLEQPAADLPEQPSDDGEQDVEQFDDAISWSAYEYIHQEKGKTWFVIFSVVMLALLGVSIFFQQWSLAVLVAVIAAVIVVSSKRPPRELTYSLSGEGLTIDGKIHPLDTFKAFGIIHDGGEYSVMLIPTQRFLPGVTVYFPEEAGEDIVDFLGSHMPMKDLKLDAVDRVVRLLRL